MDAKVALCEVFAKGGDGGVELAKLVVETIANTESKFRPIYDLELPIKDKIEAIAKNIYGADGVQYTSRRRNQIRRLSELGFDKLPVCMAKTQYSLSDNRKRLGRPKGFDITVRER